jgi:outer membrane protein
MTNKILIIFLTLLICSVCLAEGASKSSQTADINSILLVGPGVWVTTKPYRGVDPTVVPIPAVIAVVAPFFYKIDTAGCRVFSDSNMTFDFIAKLRTDGYDEEDSKTLEHMHNRHMTVDAGGEFAISGNWGKLYTSIVTDAMGQHDGQEFRVTYAKPFEFEKSKISPSVGFALLSSKLANYYYGVRNDEATPDRPAYEPGVSYKPFVGLDAYGQLDKDWTLFTSITYYRLDSGLRKSPIVNKDYEISILTGVLYRFK